MKSIKLEQEFSIEVKVPDKKVPTMMLLFEDGKSINVPVLSLVRGVKLGNNRPIGFYFKPNQPNYGVTKEQFMIWLHEEFKHIFSKNSSIFYTYLPLIKYNN